MLERNDALRRRAESGQAASAVTEDVERTPARGRRSGFAPKRWRVAQASAKRTRTTPASSPWSTIEESPRWREKSSMA